MTTVIVSGAIANRYLNGGEVWIRLSWVLGLRKLGFKVYFVEQIEPGHCVDETGAVAAFDRSVNLAWFKRIIEGFGLTGSAALVYGRGERTYGVDYHELLEIADAAALLVNISGHLTLEPLKRRLRRKVYVDEDPGFTQLWHAEGNLGAQLDGHDFYFTLGANVGTPACEIPVGDIRWRPIEPVLVLDCWPVCADGAGDRLTTVASWRGPYGPLQLGDKTLGLKVHEFRKFIPLPARVSQTCEIALDIDPADRRDLDALRDQGWQIVEPGRVVPDPFAFRAYVQGSGAEFSVAKGVYVDTNSGWFSDRTVRYLASGKPALVQDTGFGRTYPVGEGLIPFRTLDEAVAGAREIAHNYQHHCRAARAIAEEYFNSDRVLGRFLNEVGVTP